MDAGLDAAADTISEGDKLGSVKVPANSSERSKLEGERNSDALSPSRSGVNKEMDVQLYVNGVVPPEEIVPYV
jgi:hypothetical protein